MWSEWDWLSFLVLLVSLFAAIMSWQNNLDHNHRNTQLSQPQHAASAAASPSSSTALSTPTSTSRPAHTTSSHSPSMDMPLPATSTPVSFSSPSDEHQYIATLLQHAHTSMAQQQPMRALGLVLAAVRQQRGEEGVFDVLNETREGFGLKAHANPVRQQREAVQQQQLQQMDVGMAALSLQSQQADTSAGRVQLVRGGGGYEDTEMEMVDESDEEEEYGEEGEASIVDEELVDEAVRAGTHVQCRACGGVIARARMQAHAELWCEANGSTQSHEDR